MSALVHLSDEQLAAMEPSCPKLVAEYRLLLSQAQVIEHNARIVGAEAERAEWVAALEGWFGCRVKDEDRPRDAARKAAGR